jgi:hypothetical protein
MNSMELNIIAIVGHYSPALATRMAEALDNRNEQGSALTENLLWIGMIVLAAALVAGILYVKWRDKSNSIDLNQAPPA